MNKIEQHSYYKILAIAFLLSGLGFYFLSSSNTNSYNSGYTEAQNILEDSIRSRNIMINNLHQENGKLLFERNVYKLALDSLTTGRDIIIDSIETSLIKFDDLDSLEQSKIEKEALEYLLKLKNR